ncbi:MAG: ROK family protein [Acetanaerobacterium sp.]
MPQKRGGGSAEIKRDNRNRVYRFLYGREALSNRDIAYALGISQPTVIQNIKDLQGLGLVLENGMFESTGGRKAKAYVCDPVARCALGLDITKNHVAVVCVNLSGEIITSTRVKCEFENTPAFFEGLGLLIEEQLNRAQLGRDRVLGVGIALPAILSADRQTVAYSPVLGFTGGSLCAFADVISYPCTLYNDANAACFAEMWVRGGCENLVYLSLSNSVGGGVIQNGQMVYGQNQRGGEFGHMTIVPGGLPCYCGKNGCVDSYCRALRLSDMTGGSLEQFFQALRTHSPAHEALWEDYLYHLAIAVNDLRMAFDCDIILGGYVGSCLGDYIDRLQELVQTRNPFEPDISFLQVCRYKKEATAVGAALDIVDRFFKNV